MSISPLAAQHTIHTASAQHNTIICLSFFVMSFFFSLSLPRCVCVCRSLCLYPFMYLHSHAVYFPPFSLQFIFLLVLLHNLHQRHGVCFQFVFIFIRLLFWSIPGAGVLWPGPCMLLIHQSTEKASSHGALLPLEWPQPVAQAVSGTAGFSAVWCCSKHREGAWLNKQGSVL